MFCEGGVVQEIEWPDDGKFDTAHSFEIKDLKSRTFKFQSIKSRLRVSFIVIYIQIFYNYLFLIFSDYCTLFVKIMLSDNSCGKHTLNVNLFQCLSGRILEITIQNEEGNLAIKKREIS